MKNDKETLQKLIDEYKGDDLAGYLAENLEHIKWIKRRLNQLDQEIGAETQRHKVALECLESSKREVMKQCKHLSYTYFPDASGNNDSEYQCDHCGKSTRTLKGLQKDGQAAVRT